MSRIQELSENSFFVPDGLASILGYESDVIVTVVDKKENPMILEKADGDEFFVGNLFAYTNLEKGDRFVLETALGEVLISPKTHYIAGHITKIAVFKNTDYESCLDSGFSEFLRDLDTEFSGMKMTGSRKVSAQSNLPMLADVPYSRPPQKGKPKTKKRK